MLQRFGRSPLIREQLGQPLVGGHKLWIRQQRLFERLLRFRWPILPQPDVSPRCR